MVNKEKAELKDGAEPKRYFQFEKERDGLDYRITSLGHPIGLKTTYPKSSLQKYEVKVRKGRDRVMKSEWEETCFYLVGFVTDNFDAQDEFVVA